MTRVFVADALPDTRGALRLLLLDMRMLVVGEASDWPTALDQIPAANPDMLVVDWELPDGAHAGAALAALRATCPHLCVVVLSNRLESRQDALGAGADAFISKGEAPDRVTERLQAAARVARA
jgi:DNA-binding NarL/FixJ family response regulator